MCRGTIRAHDPSTDPQAVLRSYPKLSKPYGVCRLLPGHNDSALSPRFIACGLGLLETLDRA